jgi:hypothetical protein
MEFASRLSSKRRPAGRSGPTAAAGQCESNRGRGIPVSGGDGDAGNAGDDSHGGDDGGPLALAFSTPGFNCTDLAAGAAWLALLPVPAIAGAARTETASSAAEIVLIMVVSS